MNRLIDDQTKIADATAIGVNALAAWTWLDQVNDVLQFILTVAGIVAAVAAARYHLKKTKALDERKP